MTDAVLARARTGDGDAFSELVEPHRRELQVHCYRILGSLQDAEDLVQETLVAAWRGLDRFEERASLRVWLYRIATNRCLNALRDRGRRPKEAAMVEPPEPTRLSEPTWLEPYPDVLLDGIGDVSLGPEARYEATEAIALAFVAALQHLPPRQRCVLVLRDVLGLPSAEVADILGGTDTAVKAALQRARATLRAHREIASSEHAVIPPSTREREIVDRFAAAVEAGDIEDMVALLADDAWLDDAPRALRVPGPSRHRQVPRRPGQAARRQPRARADPGERPAGVRLLPAGRPRGHRPRLRPDGPHAAQATRSRPSRSSPTEPCWPASACPAPSAGSSPFDRCLPDRRLCAVPG